MDGLFQIRRLFVIAFARVHFHKCHTSDVTFRGRENERERERGGEARACIRFLFSAINHQVLSTCRKHISFQSKRQRHALTSFFYHRLRQCNRAISASINNRIIHALPGMASCGIKCAVHGTRVTKLRGGASSELLLCACF